MPKRRIYRRVGDQQWNPEELLTFKGQKEEQEP